MPNRSISRRTGAVAIGLFATLALLGLVSRPSQAMKEDSCLNQHSALCRMTETCWPNGFEPNGTCLYNYSVRKDYWKY
jgi:hypothetical protein